MASVDTRHWTLLSAQTPTLEFAPLMAAGVPARSEFLIESFLVQFIGMPSDRPEHLYRSRLGIRPKYESLDRGSYASIRPLWLRPTFDNQQVNFPFPIALVASGQTFRTFEIIRWYRYGRNGVGRNRDPNWSIRLYESIYPQNSVPPDYTQLPPSDWNWIPPGFNP